nr:PREDICTED: SEC14 domain and spectrin repeat-containing protein 1-B-like [Latimeria chalumnae]|eukprot:XP_006014103.2 PREDICTED: SEC14 domain and spectrin repeat-containing protein 1-B-like [Latimeria chalumnae]
MEATSILPVLKKRLAFLSGGKDRRSGLILTIPLCSEQTNMDELSATLDYLLSIPSETCKARGFTVIVDGRKSQWNVVKTVVLMLQVSILLTIINCTKLYQQILQCFQTKWYICLFKVSQHFSIFRWYKQHYLKTMQLLD